MSSDITNVQNDQEAFFIGCALDSETLFKS